MSGEGSGRWPTERQKDRVRDDVPVTDSRSDTNPTSTAITGVDAFGDTGPVEQGHKKDGETKAEVGGDPGFHRLDTDILYLTFYVHTGVDVRVGRGGLRTAKETTFTVSLTTPNRPPVYICHRRTERLGRDREVTVREERSREPNGVEVARVMTDEVGTEEN